MRRLGLIAALIATTFSSAALAEDWVEVAESRTGNKFWVDTDSIRTQSNGYKRSWQWLVLSAPDELGYNNSKYITEFDCRDERIRDIQTIFYSGMNIVHTINEPADWRYVVPGSAREAIFKFVCFGTLPE